eukprot:GGOE01015105.1.p1 GENE.GGOE01015105.1~~GGOE01015105.1.p1  ORF type:complete len:462 (+),score=89.66 GGOE01015105.1:50-1387(+)
MGPKALGAPPWLRLCLALAAAVASSLSVLWLYATTTDLSRETVPLSSVPRWTSSWSAALQVDQDEGVRITTNVPPDVKPLLPMMTNQGAPLGTTSIPRPSPTPSVPLPPHTPPSSKQSTRLNRLQPAETSQRPCNTSLQRRGRWVPRVQADPTLQLFGLPLPLWYLPADPRCDFPIVRPQQACQCLHKVAFIGDSITMGFFQIFAEYVTQKEDIILRRNVSRAEDTKDCFGGPLYDPTGHIRYKPCIPLMEPHIYAPACDLHAHYMRVNKYMPGKDGTERELRRHLAGLAAVDTAPIDVVVLNFGLHHMVAWSDRILAAYPGFVRRALEVALSAAPAASVLWLGITAQHAAKKPPQWRQLQSNDRVRQFNSAAFQAVDELRSTLGDSSRLASWDVLPLTEPTEADALSWDGVHYVRHLNTMRTLILLSHLAEPHQRCWASRGRSD